MQDKIVNAFRMRLIRSGFTHIYISNNFDGTYYLKCLDPNDNFIRCDLTKDKMSSLPHIVWDFD